MFVYRVRQKHFPFRTKHSIFVEKDIASYQSFVASDVSNIFENLVITYLECNLQILPKVDLEGDANLCIKNQPSNTHVVSVDKTSIPHLPNVQISSARLLLCASHGIPELSNNEEG